jgi:hypothetical protein
LIILRHIHLQQLHKHSADIFRMQNTRWFDDLVWIWKN